MKPLRHATAVQTHAGSMNPPRRMLLYLFWHQNFTHWVLQTIKFVFI